jgi:hypothetical protein
MDPDQNATSSDHHDRSLLLIGMFVAAGLIALLTIRPLRRISGSLLSLLLRGAGLFAILKVVNDQLTGSGEAREAIDQDEEEELDWDLPDEMEPGERPTPRRSSGRR